MATDIQMTIPEVKMLLSAVERRFDRTLATSNDFEALSESIAEVTRQRLSASTLKRLWGYVTSKPVPRISTLDILSQYAGRKNFREFCNSLPMDPEFQSRFFSAKLVRADSLEKSARLALSWNPDRLVTLEYLGDQRFRVISSYNSHIEIGDEFYASTFMLGHPLFLPSIMRRGQTLPPYVAGIRDGITSIEIL